MEEAPKLLRQHSMLNRCGHFVSFFGFRRRAWENKKRKRKKKAERRGNGVVGRP